MKKLKKLDVFECPNCAGAGYHVDWHYENQLGAPVGFSKAAQERQERLVRMARPTCRRCGGSGIVTLKEAK